jgi:hypothetical protein
MYKRIKKMSGCKYNTVKRVLVHVEREEWQQNNQTN